MRTLPSPLLTLAALLSAAGVLLQDLSGQDQKARQTQGRDWPQWRGPDLDGISRETKWRADGDGEILWSADIGLGYSNVSIARGKVYSLGHNKSEGVDKVRCLDAETGDVVWTFEFKTDIMAKYHPGGSLTTPAVDGKLLFVSNRAGKFFCLDATKGKLKWKKDVVKRHKARIPTWGLSASPMVLEDMIILNVGKVLAYKRSGKLIWKSKDSGHAYSNPASFKHKGKSRLAVFNGDGLVILDQKSGREIARSKWKTRYDVNAATPIVLGDKIFISSGYNRGCSMLQFNGKQLKTLWENREMRNKMSGCVAYKDHLYGFDESTVKCLNMAGEVMWTKRGLGDGALVLANGKLLMISKRGRLAIAEATHEEYRELSEERVLERASIQWTTPVLCNGLIYCRSNSGQLVCVDRRATAK